MIDFFIQNELNIMILYMSSKPKSLCLPTSSWICKSASQSTDLSKSVNRGKTNLLLDDLLQKVNDTLFDNPFADQHRFDYSKPNNNEDDKTLNLNVIVNIDNDVDNDIDNDINDEIIPHVLEYGDASKSSFVVSHDWSLSH